MTTRDELAFSRVLREFCPNVILAGSGYVGDEYKTGYVPTIPLTTLSDVFIGVPAPGQARQWSLNRDMGFQIVHPWVKFELRRSKWEWWDPTRKWAFDLPLLGWGELVVGFPRENDDLKKFAMKLLRLVNKVTWKRTGYGLDSCLWSQAGKNERRGLGAGHVFPSDETVVLNEYYDDTLWDDALPADAALPGLRQRS